MMSKRMAVRFSPVGIELSCVPSFADIVIDGGLQAGGPISGTNFEADGPTAGSGPEAEGPIAVDGTQAIGTAAHHHACLY